MFILSEFLDLFTQKITATFNERVICVGIQGSCARGEATEKSDIDVVVILDKFSYMDLKAYDNAISNLPYRDKICGYISGIEELKNWEKSELFQFYYDTKPIIGNLEFLKSSFNTTDILRAIKQGACSIYHMCVHNAIHEKSKELLHDLFKLAKFVLVAKHFIDKGVYVGSAKNLADVLSIGDAEILLKASSLSTSEDFDNYSESLIKWASGIITYEKYKF